MDNQRFARVVAADDHGVFLDGLSLLFQGIDGFELVATASDADLALTAVLAHRPDVLLLDLSMPGVAAKQVLLSVAELSSETRVIALTMHCDPRVARELLALGLHGYLLKEQSFEQIENAMQMVLDGEQYLSPSIREALQAQEAQGQPTEREREVLTLLVEGLANKVIARKLEISERTVRFHISNCCIKLGAVGRTQAATEAIRRALVQV